MEQSPNDKRLELVKDGDRWLFISGFSRLGCRRKLSQQRSIFGKLRRTQAVHRLKPHRNR